MSSSEEPQTTTTETSDVAVAAESTTTTTTTTADVETAPPVVDIVQEAQVVQAEPEEEVKQEDEAVKDEVKNSQEAPATEIETETKPETTETTEKEQKQPAAKNGTAGGKYEPEQYRKVFIGSLSYSTVEEGLRKHFSQFGEIIDCVVMKEGKSNKSRGFGFVTYSCSTMVDELMKNRPHKLDGRELETKRATPREEIGKPGAEASVNKLFVGAIRDGVNEESLKEYFSKYGTILDCVIMREKDSQKSRGFGFITFDDYDPVDKIVLEKFHTINGQSIAVKKALTKEQQQVGPIVNHHSNGHDAKPYSRPRSQKAGAANQGQNNRNQQQQQNGGGGGGGGNKNNRNHGNHGNHHYNRNNNNNHYNNAAVNYGNDYFPNAAAANYPPMNNNINNQGYYQSYNQPGPDRYSNNNNNYHNQHYHQPNNSHYSNNQVDYNSGYDNYDDKPMNGNGYNHHHIAANDYSPNQSYSSNNTGVVSPNVGGGGNNNNNNNNPIGNMNLGNIALFAQKMLQAASMQLQTGGGGSVTGTVPNPQVPLGAGQQRKNTNMNMINNDDLNGGYDSYSNNNSSGGGYGINNNNVGYHNNNNNNGMMGSGPNTGMYGGGGGGMMDNGIMNNSQQQMGGGGQVGPIRAHNGMGGGGRGRQNGPYGGGRRKN